MHIGSIPGYLRGIAETLEDGEWYEGDVVVHNHPYFGSSHTPDLAIVVPVFLRGRIVGFAANTAHHVDIGAATPGSSSTCRTSSRKACSSPAQALPQG